MINYTIWRNPRTLHKHSHCWLYKTWCSNCLINGPLICNYRVFAELGRFFRFTFTYHEAFQFAITLSHTNRHDFLMLLASSAWDQFNIERSYLTLSSCFLFGNTRRLDFYHGWTVQSDFRIVPWPIDLFCWYLSLSWFADMSSICCHILAIEFGVFQ